MLRTPTAVCSVRGTEFGVDVDGTGDTHVQMFGGLLAVSDKSGNEVLIKDRESVDVTKDGLGRVADAAKPAEPGSRRGRGKDSRYVRLPAELAFRAELAGVDAVAICALAINAACDATDSGREQTLTFGFKMTRSLDVQRSSADA